MNESAAHPALPATSAPPVPPPPRVSEIFDPARWREIAGFAHGTGAPAGLTDVTYHRGCARDADGGWAFSSGGDQRIRGRDGYRYEREDAAEPDGTGAPACSPPAAVAHTETVGCASSSLAKTVRTSGSSSTIMTLTGTMGPSVMRASFLMSRGRRPRHQIVPRGRSQSGSCTRILG